MTFGTQENFYTECMLFEVANFETMYNVFLMRLTLTKFMSIPHCADLVLKMPRPHGVISVKGDIKQAYNCDNDSCEMANKLTASTELQELRKALVESHPDQIMAKAKTSQMSIQPMDSLSNLIPLSLDEPSNVPHVGNTPKSK
jgi:hypothetical protein